MSDEKIAKVKQRLKSLLEKEKQKEIVDRVMQLSAVLGTKDNFIFSRSDGETLSTIDMDKLRQFVEAIGQARQDIEAEYFFATKSLAGDDE